MRAGFLSRTVRSPDWAALNRAGWRSGVEEERTPGVTCWFVQWLSPSPFLRSASPRPRREQPGQSEQARTAWRRQMSLIPTAVTAAGCRTRFGTILVTSLHPPEHSQAGVTTRIFTLPVRQPLREADTPAGPRGCCLSANPSLSRGQSGPFPLDTCCSPLHAGSGRAAAGPRGGRMTQREPLTEHSLRGRGGHVPNP